MKIRRHIAWMTALIMTMLLCIPTAAADVSGDIVVSSAPLTRSTTTQDGMVRVYLSAMGSLTAMDITIMGEYTVDGAVTMNLSDGAQVHIAFDTSTGNITMAVGGVAYQMGQEMRLCRRQASGESAVKISQARRPSNYYAGDLQLIAQQSSGVYKLYPILHVYIEYYLYGVVPYEMSSSWPLESLKAQAVAARTFTLRRMNGRSAYIYDLTDTASDQVYYGYTGSTSNAIQAVDDTKGIVIMNGSSLSGTYYTASNGGQTEAVKNVWGSGSYSYLGVKDDPFDAMNPNSNRRRLTIYADFDASGQNATLASILTGKAQAVYGSGASIVSIDSITPHTPKYEAPSRLYTQIDFGVTMLVGGAYQDGTLTFSIFDDLESQLSLSINSTANELWSVESVDGGYQLTVGRWGHGIGLSQRGAQQMGNMGYTYDQILGFYYEGCTRVQYTFTHTILPGNGGGEVVTTEAPATISPSNPEQAMVSLVGVNDVAALRYTASAAGKVLTGIPNGSYVTVLDQGSSWTLVQYGAIVGYLPTESLTFSGTPPTSSTQSPTNITQWAVNTGSSALNFRTGPSMDAGIQGELPLNAVLCVLGTSGTWSYVQYGQQTGYCASEYLTFYSSYPGTISETATYASVYMPDGGDAPLRSSASMSAAILLSIAHGTQVNVLSNDGTWAQVEVNGITGYMLCSQLSFGTTGTLPTDQPTSAPTDSPETMYAMVNTTSGPLNLREGPGTSYEVIGEIPKGTIIVVTSYGDTWCAVSWNGLSGYVMTSYLNFDVVVESPDPEETASPTPTASGLPAGTIAYTSVASGLYEFASDTSELLLSLPAGESVTLVTYGSEWCCVTYYGMTGYMLTSTLNFMVAEETETPTPTPTPTPTASPTPTVSFEPIETNVPAGTQAQVILAANFLEAADTSSTVLARIAAGEIVTIVEYGDSWTKISYAGMEGYVLTSQLMILTDEDATPSPEPSDAPTASPTEEPTATPSPEASDAPVETPEQVTSAPAEPSELLVAWVVSTVTEINLRKVAAQDAEIITTIPAGTQVTVIEAWSTWTQVRYQGETGYVFTRHLTYADPNDTFGVLYVNTASDALAMRDKPTTSGSTVITYIDRGEMVTLLEDLGSWCHVQYGTQTGYCASAYLSREKPGAVVSDDTPLYDSTLTSVTGWQAIVSAASGSSLYIRQWCSTRAPAVCEIQDGASVTLLQKGDIWCKISYEGEVGYCLTQDLTLTEPTV